MLFTRRGKRSYDDTRASILMKDIIREYIINIQGIFIHYGYNILLNDINKYLSNISMGKISHHEISYMFELYYEKTYNKYYPNGFIPIVDSCEFTWHFYPMILYIIDCGYAEFISKRILNIAYDEMAYYKEIYMSNFNLWYIGSMYNKGDIVVDNDTHMKLETIYYDISDVFNKEFTTIYYLTNQDQLKLNTYF